MGGDAHGAERAVHGVDFLRGRAVDDAGAAQAKNQPCQRPQPSGAPALDDLETQVRAMGRGRDHQGILQVENADQVFANRGRGGGGERQDRRAPVTLEHFGASAPGGKVMEEFGFTAASVEAAARSLLQ